MPLPLPACSVICYEILPSHFRILNFYDSVNLIKVNFYIQALTELQNVFPNIQPEEVRLPLENASGCIEAATAILLADSGKLKKTPYLTKAPNLSLSALLTALKGCP